MARYDWKKLQATVTFGITKAKPWPFADNTKSFRVIGERPGLFAVQVGSLFLRREVTRHINHQISAGR